MASFGQLCLLPYVGCECFDRPGWKHTGQLSVWTYFRQDEMGRQREQGRITHLSLVGCDLLHRSAAACKDRKIQPVCSDRRLLLYPSGNRISFGYLSGEEPGREKSAELCTVYSFFPQTGIGTD